jgi:uncharacterized protein (TIGR02594 family)
MTGQSQTAFDVARRLVGVVKERPGDDDHPFIAWCHEVARLGTGQHDETPWCSSFVCAMALLLGLPSSRSAAARSWLAVGQPIDLDHAIAGNDVVILTRAGGGHVGFYAGHSAQTITLLGGNQGNAVSLATFDRARLLGVRRLA